jgi:hypothetical protein
MSEYQLTSNDSIIRTEDGACIPADPANRDYAEYLKWLEDGGVPDPYVPPEKVPPEPTIEDRILYDHENRLRTVEGVPLLEFDIFMEHKNGTKPKPEPKAVPTKGHPANTKPANARTTPATKLRNDKTRPR